MKPTQNSKWRETQASTSRNAGHLLGEAHALLQQIGSMGTLAPIDEVVSGLRLDGIHDLKGLASFLETYHSQILQTIEFPAIARAYWHASRGEARELIALDEKLAQIPHLEIFAQASQQIGRLQLKRLRPLRDQRVVQRYLAALDSGKALAWHPLVYGVTLAVFSLPLRQALVHYAEETLSGLAFAAARSHHFREASCREILEPLFARLPASIEDQAACKPAPWQLLAP